MKKRIICLLLVLMMVASFGCGKKTPSPSKVVSDTLDGVKSESFEDLMDESMNDFRSLMGDEGVKLFFDIAARFEYKILDEKIDGNSANVEIEFTSYDLGGAFIEIFTEYIAKALALEDPTEDEVLALFEGIAIAKLQELDKAKADTTGTCTVSLSKVDGQWEIDDLDSNLEFFDAMLGGFYTALYGIIGE